MRIIGIDASLTSTAVFMEDRALVFTTNKPGKWHKLLEGSGGGTVKEVSYKKGTGYSDTEIAKLVSYRSTATELVLSLGLRASDDVRMEGYAFRASGDLIDLVVYGTFIREAILACGASLRIVAPTSLKSSYAEFVYGRVDGPKKPPRNYRGIAGGKFTKFEMLEATKDAYESKLISGDFARMACESSMDILGVMKSVPAPLNDCIDAYALTKIQ